MSHIATMTWLEQRMEWLQDHDREEKDVMMDDNGIEYIMVEKETMDEGEEESWGFRKMSLPDSLQINNEREE